MTLDEWIALYDLKTPEPFQRDERYELFFRPDKGFCEVGMTRDMAIINQLCGDARFWRDAVTKMAQKIGIKMCGTWCIRKEILAYIRLFGYRVKKKETLDGGLVRYYCRHKDTGKMGLASPAFKYESGGQAYFITWEV